MITFHAKDMLAQTKKKLGRVSSWSMARKMKTDIEITVANIRLMTLYIRNMRHNLKDVFFISCMIWTRAP